MQLCLEITDGELKGSWTFIRDGLTIGRKNSTLSIRDSKISGKHAAIEERSDGTFWLVDLGSQNGIKQGGEKLQELLLYEGTSFQLGKTSFHVHSWDDDEIEARAKKEVAPLPPKAWNERLKDLFARAAKRSEVSKKPVTAFQPAVVMEFIKGPQTGEVWVIGYGPRVAGTASPDLTLQDPELPGVCFKLLPEDDSVVFKNESDARINGKWIENKVLRNSDVIEIKSTQIRVKFHE